jgi:hypothetical protein
MSIFLGRVAPTFSVLNCHGLRFPETLRLCVRQVQIAAYVYVFSFAPVACEQHAEANWFCSLQIYQCILGPHQKQRLPASFNIQAADVLVRSFARLYLIVSSNSSSV